MRMFGITGSSGSGKTTLIATLLPLLRARGLRVSALKHAHHGFDIDRPGKDSFRFREAGAQEVMLVTGTRWALLHEAEDGDDLSLPALLRRMAPVDLVIVEGFRMAQMPKLEVYRPSVGKAPYFADDPGIIAIASDAACAADGRLVLALNEPERIADFILDKAVAV